MPMHMKHHVILAGLLSALAAGAASAGEPTIHVSVGGEIAPGVYGRVDFGNAPPPPVVYQQPVIIARPVRPVVVAPQPVYMAVPPGHAKNWSKHCHRYDACGVPVYFVKTGEYEPRGEKGRGHGRGHGKHGKDD